MLALLAEDVLLVGIEIADDSTLLRIDPAMVDEPDDLASSGVEPFAVVIQKTHDRSAGLVPPLLCCHANNYALARTA